MNKINYFLVMLESSTCLFEWRNNVTLFFNSMSISFMKNGSSFCEKLALLNSNVVEHLYKRRSKNSLVGKEIKMLAHLPMRNLFFSSGLTIHLSNLTLMH